MLEILFLVSVVLAIYAINISRNNSRRLAEEIVRLKRDVEALKKGAVAASADLSVDEREAAEALLAHDDSGDVPSGVDEIAGPWTKAAASSGDRTPGDSADMGRSIFGGASSPEGEVQAARVSVEDAVTTAEAPSVRPRESLESRIGARWAVWVGGIALALGGVFMVKYSIEAGLLSPAVRLSLAALFGLVLIAGGEVIRRRAQPIIADAFQNAMIPGVLTAAGAITLFGVTYVSYGFYGYFGPATAFALLGLVAFATIGLSLLHGQALAGLGLLASMATPLLVSTGEPKPWALFGFLTVSWLATLAASWLRRWQVVPAVANMALGLWAVLYLSEALPADPLPATLSLLVLIGGIGFLWPGNESVESESARRVTPGGTPISAWEHLLAPPAMAVSLTGALAVLLPSLVLATMVPGLPVAAWCFATLVLALAALGAWRCWGIYPTIFSAFTALAGTVIIAALPGGMLLDTFGTIAPPTLDNATPITPIPTSGTAPVNLILALAAAYAAAGAVALFLRGRRPKELLAVWSVLMAGVPLGMTVISFFVFGNLSFDLKHGLFALAFGVTLFAAAEFLSRSWDEAEGIFVPQWALAAGGFAFLVLSLHALTDGLVTTLGIAILGTLAVFATRARGWPVLPWLMVGAAVVVAGRIAFEPTIVGAANLSKTPLFNQLLAGYGIPAALLALCAFELRRWPGERVRNLLQALASLFVLLTAAILVRHAMNGGVLDSSVPTLGEQSIYTLLVIGASAVMMTLDLKSPSPVFRYGSMAVGVLSVLSIASAHFIGLNPYFTGELTGSMPVLDLLLIGYLLPGFAYAGLAYYARGRRPLPYVMMLALTGAALAFAWVTLSVRRYWHGPNIADWKGFLQSETYTYSVVWLLLGVVLLVLGSKFDAKSIRLASAGLVLIAVVKVFLIDMSNLEGILRALSFIGLGAVLIGIGLFYQKILSGKTAPADETELKPQA
jgi:uncharacterized membrane protein